MRARFCEAQRQIKHVLLLLVRLRQRVVHALVQNDVARGAGALAAASAWNARPPQRMASAQRSTAVPRAGGQDGPHPRSQCRSRARRLAKSPLPRPEPPFPPRLRPRRELVPVLEGPLRAWPRSRVRGRPGARCTRPVTFWRRTHPPRRNSAQPGEQGRPHGPPEALCASRGKLPGPTCR